LAIISDDDVDLPIKEYEPYPTAATTAAAIPILIHLLLLDEALETTASALNDRDS